MKKIKKAISVLLCFTMLFGFAGVSANAGDTAEFTADMPRVLQSGYYIADGAFNFSGSDDNVNGLEIAEGATVCIEITEGSVLTVRGKDAHGTTAAGAGILVPEGATLIIRGSGSLKATGGSAADGANGFDGGDGKSRINGSDEAEGGTGGLGGNGGGGAGAGIGGMGGKGGVGGVGGFGAHVKDSDGYYHFESGKPGQPGGKGLDGMSMGSVYINADVDLDVAGGAGGQDGKSGKFGAHSLFNASGTLYDYCYGAGGGAGGGGKGGHSAAPIGGGGAGGAGGGSGGGGAAMCNDYTSAPGAGAEPHSEAGSGFGGGYNEFGEMVLFSKMFWDEGVSVYGGNAGLQQGSGADGKNGKCVIHSHDFDKGWTYTETAHWHSCAAEDCDIALVPGIDYSNCGEPRAAYGEHQWENGKCAVCGFDGFMMDNNGIVTKYCGPGGDIVFPDGAVAVVSDVLRGGDVTGITLSQSVLNIGRDAFSDCDTLTKLDLGAVSVIGESAFENCAALNNIRIPSSVEIIEEKAFYNCSSLTTVTVEWTKAEDIVIPCENAFAEAGAAPITLRVPVGTAELYKAADVWKDFNIVDDHDHNFESKWTTNYYAHWHACAEPGCPIKDYSSCGIDEAAYGMHDWADGVCSVCGRWCIHFWIEGKCDICGEECTHTWRNGKCTNCSLKCTHDWQNGVCTICGFDGFIIADSILEEYAGPDETVTVPETVTEIGYNVFTWTAVKKIILPETVTVIKMGAFQDSSQLEEIVIPDSVKEIGMLAFERCKKLKSITVPGAVRVINTGTFGECDALKSVTIPESVKFIYDHAFARCSALEDIYVSWPEAGAIPSVDSTAFYKVDISSVRLHVPEGTGDIYEKDEFWGNFIIVDPYVEAQKDALDALRQAKADCISDEAKTVLDIAAARVEKAGTVAQINEIKQTALIAAERADENLIAARASAVEELNKIKAACLADTAKAAVAAGIGAVNGATSVAGVTEILENVKKEAAALDTVLSDAKAAATTTLENAKSKLVTEDYIAAIDEAIGNIDKAADVESVNEYEAEGMAAFENAIAEAKKAAVDEITSGQEGASDASAAIASLAEKAISLCESEKDIIALKDDFSSALKAQAAKEEAIESLGDAAEKCVSDEAKAVLSAAVPKVIEAADAQGVNNVLSTALAAAAAADKALADARDAAKAELAAAKENAKSDDAKAALDEAAANVDKATNPADVAAAKEAGIANAADLNDMTTADVALAQAKAQAKDAIDKALGSEPTKAAKAAAEKAKAEIDKADSVSKVKAAQDEGEKNVAEGQKICDYCGKEHKNFFDNIICFFKKIVIRIKSLFGAEG